MVHVPKEKRRKWEEVSNKLMFVGFPETQKVFRMIDPATGKITSNRNVEFFEKVMFFSKKVTSIKPLEPNQTSTPWIFDEDLDEAAREDQDLHDGAAAGANRSAEQIQMKQDERSVFGNDGLQVSRENNDANESY